MLFGGPSDCCLPLYLKAVIIISGLHNNQTHNCSFNTLRYVEIVNLFEALNIEFQKLMPKLLFQGLIRHFRPELERRMAEFEANKNKKVAGASS